MERCLACEADSVGATQLSFQLAPRRLALARPSFRGGFGDGRFSGEANALRELESEAGYAGDHVYLLGTTITNSGLSDAQVSFYHIPIVRSIIARHEAEEAIIKVHLATPQQLWQDIQSGKIRDGFTLQAYALYCLRSKLSRAGENQPAM